MSGNGLCDGAVDTGKAEGIVQALVAKGETRHNTAVWLNHI